MAKKTSNAKNVSIPNKPMPKTRLRNFIGSGGKEKDFCSSKDSSGLVCGPGKKK